VTGSATPVHSYSAEDAPRGFLRHLRPLVHLPAEIARHRFLVMNFFRRELLGRFRGSLLGVFWVLVHPIFLFTIYYLVFGLLFGNWKVGQSPDPSFAIYLFSGVVAFQALIEATSRSCTIVVENGNLVKKVAFPSHLLPVHVNLVALLVYLVGATVCTVSGVAFGVLHPGLSLLALPLVLLLQFTMAYGLGLFLANLQVFSRDTNHLWGIAATAWMFVTPVFWWPNMMTKKFGLEVGSVFDLNPAAHLVQAHRIALGAVDFTLQNGDGTETLISFGSLWEHLGVMALWALALLVIGYGTFTSRSHRYADLV
jgi:lipopolysaccharide transport system permease protein